MSTNPFRAGLLERDGRCLVCGKHLTIETIHPHHIKTRGSGGDDSLGNGISLCYRCHDSVHRGYVELAIPVTKIDVTDGLLYWLLFLAHDIEPKIAPDEWEKDMAEVVRGQYAFDDRDWLWQTQ